MSTIRSRSVKKLQYLDVVSYEMEGDEYDSSEWLSTRVRSRSRYYHSCKWIFLFLFALGLILTMVSIQNADITRQILSVVPFLYSSKAQKVLLGTLSSDRPPLVNRRILEKLESLASSDSNYLEDAADFDDLTRTARSWPPRVTQIPEQHTLDRDILPNLVTPAELERQSCSLASIDPITSSCRFILPLLIGEQESKARIHLLQLFQLAKSLNRTLVLPNVGKSRLGACLKWDFDVYYNGRQFLDQIETSTSGYYDDVSRVDAVTMDSFKSWMNNRLQRPVGQIISVNWTRSTRRPLDQLHPLPVFRRKDLDVYVHHDLVDPSTHFKRARCLNLKFNRLDISDTYSPLSIVFTTHSKKSLENGSLAQALVEELYNGDNYVAAHRKLVAFDAHDQVHYDEGASKQLPGYANNHLGYSPDVLIVNWDLRFPLFPAISAPLVTLNYSHRIHALTTRLTQPMSPYLAVHWRMESVSPEVLPTCAEDLVSTLHNLLNKNGQTIGAGINYVWLATDIPSPLVSGFYGNGTTPAEETVGSGTFKILTEDHIQALQILKDAFSSDYGGVLSCFKLVGLTGELARMKRDGEEIDYLVDGSNRQEEILQDSGVLGILDKSVAMRSAIFVSGGNRCGRVSSFTKQIVDWRESYMSFKSNIVGVARDDNGLRNIVHMFG